VVRQATQLIVAEGMASSLTCPLYTSDRPVGFLFFSSTSKHAYTEHHARLFQRIGVELSHAVEKSRLYGELEILATSDPLTGAANRRVFDERLDREWRRGVRSRQPLSVLMIDVDHFKRYNDALGHGAGDACLRRVAEVLGTHLQRAEDLLCRYGGEEFAAILPGTLRTVAVRHAEVLREAIERLEIDHPDSPDGRWLTVSIGCATAIPGPAHTPLGLVDASDRSLCEAKRQGRDRCLGVSLPAVEGS
jgi:diguanylate cyclase (GGDEF)-like protein